MSPGFPWSELAKYAAGADEARGAGVGEMFYPLSVAGDVAVLQALTKNTLQMSLFPPDCERLDRTQEFAGSSPASSCPNQLVGRIQNPLLSNSASRAFFLQIEPSMRVAVPARAQADVPVSYPRRVVCL